MSDPDVAEILSPTSPTLASAVFGSAPRPRRPSTPKSPPSGLSRSQPQTPSRSDKALPPVPTSTQSKSVRTKNPPPRARLERRPDSPDVDTMIARTPRPRRKSSATFRSPMARVRSNSSMAVPSSWKGVKSKEDDGESVISDYGTLLEKEAESEEDKPADDDGSESDSSIDIHTPLPHLMFRDGLLSPRSKLLPGGGSATLSLYIEEDEDPGKRANSVLSLASTAASTMTKSGIYRDPRDTQRRRNRHKDQTLLRAGMGLTTGLGWSDSEDEDAPSLLTRRLITTNIARQPSVYSTTSRAPSQLAKSHSVGNLSHAPPSYSPAPRSGSRTLTRSTSATSASSSLTRLSTIETESVTSIDTGRPTRSRTQSNASASSIVSSGSRDSSSAPQSVTSSQAHTTTPSRAAVPRPLRLPQTAGIQTPSVTRTTSATESRPPVSAASKLAGASQTRPRTRTLSNPGSRPTNTFHGPRSVSSRIVPPRSVTTSVMAPVRSMSTSISPAERNSILSNSTLSEFPLPPGLASSASSPGLVRPSVGLPKPGGAQYGATTVSAPSTPPTTSRVLNTVGTGPRPRPLPRTGTGMLYRNSSYTGPSSTGGRTSIVS
ncbi:hypothetical protein C8Q76DRAFT_689056 [Earliella scabrosa]|nr:hypothetical protein C8Q76DRAFT_689056 [Earliella scabrosa]